MTIAPTENAPWGVVQWLATGSVTLLASGLAFIWRLMLRLEKLEIAHTTQRAHFEASRAAGDSAILRLAERMDRIQDDHARVREAVGALPTRADLRDLEDRLIEQLVLLGARLDRIVNS